MIIKGEIFALFTAISWTFSSLTFGKISKEYDTQVANFLRVTIGTIMVGFVCLFGNRHLFFPTDVTLENLKIISLSGIIGMFLGDLFLFKAYNMVGARVTMLIMALSPIIVSIIDFLFLDVLLSMTQIFAIFVTCFGIILVIFKNEEKKFCLGFSAKGLFYAFLATLGQSLGVILTKLGSTTYDSLATSQIRLGVAIFFFGIVVLYEKKGKETIKMITNKKSLSLLIIGTFFSVFGIAALIEAFKTANASIASTISSTSPIIMIPCSILLYKEKMKFLELLFLSLDFQYFFYNKLNNLI